MDILFVIAFTSLLVSGMLCIGNKTSTTPRDY